MSTTRPRGFAPWSPRAKTLRLLAQIDAVLIEYAEYLPLAIRQVFYRLIGAHEYEKTEPAYSRLCETIGRARRAGYISFDSIRDDGVTRLESSSWDGTQAFIDAVADTAASFKLDRQDGQQTRLWILTEAAGMAPMIAKVANQYGVPVLSSGGFDSLTAKHDLAQELSDAGCAEVLHIGDHDPSGVHLFKALREDVGALSVGLGSFTPPMFTRLAVTPQQIVEMNLPTAPAKKTDNRAFTGETVQAEAIPPDVLTELVRIAIAARQDEETRLDVLSREQVARAELSKWIASAS
jgi:hypothetical protein